MRRSKRLRIAPDRLFSYTGVMLLTAVLVSWGTGFTNFAHSLTLPSMEVDLEISHTKAGFVITLMAMVRMGSTFISGTLAPRYGSSCRLLHSGDSLAAANTAASSGELSLFQGTRVMAEELSCFPCSSRTRHRE